jgi:hypothetical protein
MTQRAQDFAIIASELLTLRDWWSAGDFAFCFAGDSAATGAPPATPVEIRDALIAARAEFVVDMNNGGLIVARPGGPRLPHFSRPLRQPVPAEEFAPDLLPGEGFEPGPMCGDD